MKLTEAAVTRITDALEQAHDKGLKDAPASLKGKPASATSLHALNDATATLVGQAAKEILAAVTMELDAQLDLIEDLQIQVTKFEASGAKHIAEAYQGTWRWGETHKRGALVTDSGSLWMCGQDTEARPGKSQDWQLIVKRGRDGKDANGR